jgi:RNA polymerase sigma-70 factor (ECF subfamily)
LNLQEANLVERLKAGEESAFQTLFEAHYLILCVYAKRIVGDADIAKEVVQVVFVRLYEHRQAIAPLRSIKAYLLTSVHNSCLNHLKQQHTYQMHHQYILQQTSTGEQADPLVELELEEKIYQVVQQLPEQCRRIFQMNRFEGKKNGKIATELGLSIRTVETQISKALKILRHQLADYLPMLLLLSVSLLK